ncbi:MAG: hypothetical protein ABSB97_09060 [Thermoplasmata archaeon]|jgi:hypothetical protein
MTASLPWSPAASNPAANDPSAVLARIEQNTAGILQWMKILVVVGIILIAVTAFLG